MPSFILSKQDIKTLSPKARKEVLALFSEFDDFNIQQQQSESEQSESEYDENELLAVLSIKMARRFIDNLSTKSQIVLKNIIDLCHDNYFYYNDLDDALSAHEDMQNLTGVWSGLTNSVRNLMGDKELLLIKKDWDADKEDSFGVLDATTYKNLKTVLDARGQL